MTQGIARACTLLTPTHIHKMKTQFFLTVVVIARRTTFRGLSRDESNAITMRRVPHPRGEAFTRVPRIIIIINIIIVVKKWIR